MLAAPLLFGALFGCGEETPIEPRAIHAHYPHACAPDDDSSGSRAIELRALGDFDPSNTTVAFVDGSDRDRVLAIPDRTQAVELRTVGPDAHWGVTLVEEGTETDVALWPALQTCGVLSGNTTDNSPVEGAELAINSSWLLAIGTDDSEGSARGTRLVNLGTGDEVAGDGTQMTRSRSFASLTAVEAGMLAAGGEDLEQGTVHDDAELFDLSAQRFQGNSSVIALRHARTRHAALALDASSVVLIGGADGNGQPVRDLERVSLTDGESSDLAQLGAGRIEPTALRLSDDRIVVAGGYAIGAGSQRVPIGIVEWFNSDATRQVGTLNLEDAALGRAFHSAVAGGLLAVGGCDADGQPSAAVWWIDTEQQATRLPDLPQAARSCRPELAEATLEAPFLFSNGALWRFNPWTGRFSASEIDVPSAPSTAHVLSVDSGLMVWLDGENDEMSLLALRHDTRNTYSADVTPFLLTDDTRLAPARPGVLASPSTGNPSLQLEGDVTVWITDTRYLDFDLEIVTDDSDSPPPKVLIGSSEVGGSSCRWPAATEEGVYRAHRRGAQVTLLGSRERTCSLNDASRASVGFQADEQPVRLQRISISRGTP